MLCNTFFTGGVLSHAAIVSREYGIPSVVGAKDATKKFQVRSIYHCVVVYGILLTPLSRSCFQKNGDIVRIDTSSSTVRRIIASASLINV
jgi:phosphoenolpyruvate synthase/pyruvate phosphate dikinase